MLELRIHYKIYCERSCSVVPPVKQTSPVSPARAAPVSIARSFRGVCVLRALARGTNLTLPRAAPARTHASCCGHAPSACLGPLPRSVPPMTSTLATSAPFRSIELRVDEPLFSSKQQVDVALESACCKRLFQVF
jgi:hypothetical protein